jgi:hypothetical protein
MTPPDSLDDIRAAAVRAADSLIRDRYRGYDPYDCLTSPLFRLPVLRSNKTIRFGSQQVFRRLPLNLRPLLGIRPGYNPVTLGVCVQAYSALLTADAGRRPLYEREIAYCVDELARLRSAGYSGACWGYDFDWEGRYARIPAFMPTVVATGFITNGLYQLTVATGDARATELCVSAAQFVLRDLQRTPGKEGFCFSYSPADTQQVFNATMKGARLLAQASALGGDRSLLEVARSTIGYVMGCQRPDGSWGYAENDARQWADNFHTAYILDCLDEYAVLSGDRTFAAHRERGLAYYLDRFFEGGEIPRYYDTSTFPIDATAGAQSILTLLRFGHAGRAARVARWMIARMQDPAGYFYYQQRRHFTISIPYARWSTAWMLVALSTLAATTGAPEAHP